MGAGRNCKPVVHPFPFPSCGNDTGPPQVREMAGNLWLGQLQGFYEEADAHLIIAHKIHQPQSRAIGESAEENFYVIGLDVLGFSEIYSTHEF